MKARHEPGLFSLLRVVLTDMPRLKGAACADRPGLHDASAEGEPVTQVRARHAQAVEMCCQCPCLEACREWAETEQANGGVLAGELPTAAGRPRKEVAA